MRDLAAEIAASMLSNKLRIALTGFSIGWGLFILIVLLGSGNGLMNGIAESFGSDTVCMVRLSPGTAQLAWQGMNRGRKIRLTANEAALLKKRMGESIGKVTVTNSTPSLQVDGGGMHLRTIVQGVYPNFLPIDGKKIVAGRDLADIDIRQGDKVCLIGQQTARLLFGKDGDAMGRMININQLPYLVVGVYDAITGTNSGHVIYAPFTTVEKGYFPAGDLSQIVVVANDINDQEAYDDFVDQLYAVLGEQLNFSPADHAAVVCESSYISYLQLKNVITMLQLFIWVIGLATLIAGVVGISNIMLISVRERTRELAVRRAMGASASSIITLVLIESVVVSLIFGYIGMMLGIGLTQLLSWGISAAGGVGLFDHPTVSFATVMAANLIMVLAGLIAGYFPARNAVHIKLVDALQGV